MSRFLSGRKQIFTDYEYVDASNVLEVLGNSIMRHLENANDIQYLYDYYRGLQPIMFKTKEVRPEINNKILVNRANEITSFKVGYLYGEPVQYVNRGNRDEASNAINVLNEYMFAEEKASKDKRMGNWSSICGTSYRMVLPDPVHDEMDEAPFEIYVLDPRNTFVVYWTGLGNKPVMGVKYVNTKEKGIIYSVYTETEYFEIIDNQITRHERHAMQDIPIIEYPGNFARLGDFEIVLTMLDAINSGVSDAQDGYDQLIQALLVLKGVDIDSEEFNRLREQGGLAIPQDADAKYLLQDVNHSQTKTITDDLYESVLTIVGMPNRNGGLSTSDTGSAVLLRDGWSDAEARAKNSEQEFKLAEKTFLRIVLRLCRDMRDIDLKLSDIDIRFTRRNYENIQSKSQVLVTMLNNNKIHPRLAFAHSGMFADPEVAYSESMKYYEEQMEKEAEELENLRKQAQGVHEEGADVRTDGQGSQNSGEENR